MTYVVDAHGITLYLKKHHLDKYHEQQRRRNAWILKTLTESKLRGKPCIHIQGLWCWNKNCFSVGCLFANLLSKQVEDRHWGCWGFLWADGTYIKSRDTEHLRKFWDTMPASQVFSLSKAKPLTARIAKTILDEST